MSDSSTAASSALEIRRRSPLVEQEPAAGHGVELRLEELAHRGHYNLRGAVEDAGFQKAVSEVLGFDLPHYPNTWAGDDAIRVCWVGPDEWLLITSAESPGDYADRLEQRLSGCHYALTDISSGQTIIQLQGDRARNLLSRGCPLDLHGRHHGQYVCAQTRLAKTNVLMIQCNDRPDYHIVVRRSFADYLWQWLVHVNDRLLPFD